MTRMNLLLIFFTIVLVLTLLVPSKISQTTNNYILKISQPLTSGMVKAGRSIAGILSIFAEISSLRRENHRLVEDLIRAKVDSTTLEEYQQENINLKEALEYKNAHSEMELLLAEIIGLDPTNFYDSLLLDKGSEDGAREGMAVVYLGVLVGKIDQVTPNTSRVILITSKDSIVQVMLESSRTTGILKGGISGMTLENIPLDTPVVESENVITSGLGGKLPKGIFVGNAGSEVSAKSDIFKTIEIKSPINFTKLENLFIIIGI
jgi:rod shape-determining protein MreC